MINTETDRLALLKEISILHKLNYKGLITKSNLTDFGSFGFMKNCIELQISIKNLEDEFSDMMFEDESPQSHKLPQYQLIGKLKQVVNSNNSSYYTSPIIKGTSESNTKDLELRTPILITQIIENHIQPRIANKIMNNLKNFEQV